MSFKIRWGIIFSLTCIILWIPLSIQQGWLFRIDVLIQDAFWNISYAMDSAPALLDSVAVVEIDDETYRALGGQFPLSRKKYADLIRKISSFKPRAILFDIAFVGRSNVSPEEDALLAKSIRQAGNVILSFYYSRSGRPLLPLEEIAKSARGLGFMDVPLDKDGVVRRMRAFRADRHGHVQSYSMAVRSIAFSLDVPFEKIFFEENRGLSWDEKLNLKVAKNGLVMTAFTIKPQDVKKFSWMDFEDGRVNEEALRDKIVIVGNTSLIYHDFHQTPLGKMPGLYLLLNEMSGLLEGRTLPLPSKALAMILAGIYGAAGLLLFARYYYAAGLFIFLVGALLLQGIAYFLFHNGIPVLTADALLLWLAIFLGYNLGRYISLFYQGVRLKDLAVRDYLTGLYSRKYFMLELNARRRLPWKEPLWILLLNVRFFRRINEEHGIQAGNEMIKQMASRLLNQTKGQICGRMGADVFGIILRGKPDQVENVIIQLLSMLHKPYEYQNKKMNVKMYAGGICIDAGSQEREDSLMQKAETALKEAKVKEKLVLVKAREMHLGNVENEKAHHASRRTSDLDYVASDFLEKTESLQKTLHDLLQTQEDKIRSEKIATAGIVTAKFSHELKNPLSNLTACMKVLKESLNDAPKANRYIELVQGELDRLNHLSRQMLGLFNVNKEAYEPRDLNSLIDEVIFLIEKKAGASNITIMKHLDPALPFALIAVHQMKQVVLNLCLNAMEAMPRGGELKLRTYRDSEWIRMEVQDNGVGIPEDHLQKIFDPFFTTKEGGTGLGLATSFDMIKRHEGMIQVKSEPGLGTLFTISLKCHISGNDDEKS